MACWVNIDSALAHGTGLAAGHDRLWGADVVMLTAAWQSVQSYPAWHCHACISAR